MGWLQPRVPGMAPDSLFNPRTGNTALDRQVQALRETEMREVPFPTIATPALATTARQLMLEACEGRAPRPPSDSDSELLREEFCNKYFGEDMLAGLPDIMAQKAEHDPRLRYRMLKRHVLVNPLVPLIIRIIVLAFVLAALGIAASLHVNTEKVNNVCGRTSDITFLIVWTTVAALYLILVALDEFRAAPIGLRRPWTKFALTISDFIFISFFTAGISLSFSIHSDWHCDFREGDVRGTRDGNTCGTSVRQVCKLVRTLSSLTIVCGFVWAVMFAVTISRLLAHAVYAPGAGAAVTTRRRNTIRSRYR